MWNYPVTLTPDREAGGFVVTMPDVPEVVTQGEDREEALLRAADALETALEIYVDAKRELPRPSRPGRKPTIAPSAQTCAKLEVYRAMRESGVRKSELARRLNWHLPQVDRLLNLKHASRLEHIEAALAALGRHLVVQAV